MHVAGYGVLGNSDLPDQFWCEPKTALQSEVFKRKNYSEVSPHMGQNGIVKERNEE